MQAYSKREKSALSVQRRTNDNPAIIRFHRPSEKKHPEQYCGLLLKLYLPYHSDFELKRQSFPMYETFYKGGAAQLPGYDHHVSVQHIVKQNKEKYEKNSKQFEDAVEEYEQNRGVIDEWSNLAPESELVRLEYIKELDAREPDCLNEL